MRHQPRRLLPSRVVLVLHLFVLSPVGSPVTAAAVSAGASSNNNKRTNENIPWDDLRAVLPSSTALVAPTLESWRDQCVNPFVLSDAEVLRLRTYSISNYELMDQPDGVCMSHVSCIFENCQFPTYNNPFPLTPLSHPFAIPESLDLDFLGQDPDRLRLPRRVLHPRSAADVVEAVRFAGVHNINLSVKVAGHSYMGSSTGTGLLLKMSPSYPKYAIEGTGLVECNSDSIPTLLPTSTDSSRFSNPDDWVCALALARRKQAYLRVGGGELADEAYRAVSFDWNRERTFEAGNSGRLYHLTTAAAGTVSVAGGWLASGGLAASSLMRSFGMGIDQILQLEMVLPDGQHVRFGPTEWSHTDTQKQQFLYPQTTKVSGFCNQRPLMRDEAMWEWAPCETPASDVSFDELWFAARGGGGGTWGIVTSAYYQLNDYPGIFQQVQVNGLAYIQRLGVPILSGIRRTAFLQVYTEFVLRFMFRPEDLGVSAEQSNRCSAPFLASLTANGNFYCYNNAGNLMEETWQAFVMEQAPFLQRSGFFSQEIAEMQEIMTVRDFESYADFHTTPSEFTEGIPEGRLYDRPRATVVPLFAKFPDYIDTANTLFPLEVFQGSEESFMRLVHLMVDEINTVPGLQQNFVYFLGGLMPQASDGRDSLSPTRRTVGIMKAVPSETFRNRYFEIFYQGSDMTGSFPGSICHNHALLHEMGPLKTDWTRVCPENWSFSRRQAECISFDEAVWGTANVQELMRIKASLDPINILSCPGAVGTSLQPLEFTFSLFSMFAGFIFSSLMFVYLYFCTIPIAG